MNSLVNMKFNELKKIIREKTLADIFDDKILMKEILKRAVKMANNDQRDLIKRYEETKRKKPNNPNAGESISKN